MIIYKSGDKLRCQIDSVSTCAMSEVSRDRLFIVGQVPKAVHHGLQEQRITLLAIAKRTKSLWPAGYLLGMNLCQQKPELVDVNASFSCSGFKQLNQFNYSNFHQSYHCLIESYIYIYSRIIYIDKAIIYIDKAPPKIATFETRLFWHIICASLGICFSLFLGCCNLLPKHHWFEWLYHHILCVNSKNPAFF